jgi:hypothetical protein
VLMALFMKTGLKVHPVQPTERTRFYFAHKALFPSDINTMGGFLNTPTNTSKRSFSTRNG